MEKLSAGAKQLPAAHITIRVPWHDTDWTGKVCLRPSANSSCLVLPRISENRRDAKEGDNAGAVWHDLDRANLPPCVAERASFMADRAFQRIATHPYADSDERYAHYRPTSFVHEPYSAACVPFFWMHKLNALPSDDARDNLVERHDIVFQPDLEPKFTWEKSPGWIQHRDNQLAMLDTFFSAIQPQESLCFFYAKRTPLSEDHRRTIIGVGRVTAVAKAVEYKYEGKGDMRSVLWERNVFHSIRPNGKDGFLLPYHDLLRLAEKDAGINTADYCAFAPDVLHSEFSYGSQHIGHDGAIAVLLVLDGVVQRMAGVLERDLSAYRTWIDGEVNRLWRMRGAFPGLGAALSAFGVQHGNMLAYALESTAGDADPWEVLESAMSGKKKVDAKIAEYINEQDRRRWAVLNGEERDLLKLLSRFSLSNDQATRFYVRQEREQSGIQLVPKELFANPYLLYELDRSQLQCIDVGTVDRGMTPPEAIAKKHPLPKDTALAGSTDPRRVRALLVDELEKAGRGGNTLEPADWLVRKLRSREIRPPCQVTDPDLRLAEKVFAGVIDTAQTATGQTAYQLTRLAECARIIREQVEVRHTKGKRHDASHDWRGAIDQALTGASKNADKDVEDRARTEKAAALEELFKARISVLIGPAGTGKTTLLRALFSLPEVESGGVLLLAPTGKARVQLSRGTKAFGAKTIAQFLHPDRYDGATNQYRLRPKGNRHSTSKTVIIDECSMLTEDALAAVFDALSNVERIILVGDHRQLPPIGPGRPFLDIVRRLTPPTIAGEFPKVGKGYAELTVHMRQQGEERDDLRLAQWFSGQPIPAGEDELFQRIRSGQDLGGLKLIRWDNAKQLQEALFHELRASLNLKSDEDELGFAASIGGAEFEGESYFWPKYKDRPGSASKAEDWQILCPVRGNDVGVDVLNREIQLRFRQTAMRWARPKEWWQRRTAKPFGPQGILYGDKVISLRNHEPRDVFPKVAEDRYVANGDIGVVVGQYRTTELKSRKLYPWKVEVEYASKLGTKFGYYEISDDADAYLELAYALTVHKCQGSEFGTTFLVVPNPCRLLSNELMYTALTRQRQRVVLFHQGASEDLLGYASRENSETAKRLTNLFGPPRPVEVKSKFYEEGLIHRTARGDLVRSKSELIIADKLHEAGIRDYVYEHELRGNDGSVRRPDFVINNAATGTMYVWEHLGMMSDPAYKRRWATKLQWYRAQGILPNPDGGGPNGCLIITEDGPDGGIDSQVISRLVAELSGR